MPILGSVIARAPGGGQRLEPKPESQPLLPTEGHHHALPARRRSRSIRRRKINGRNRHGGARQRTLAVSHRHIGVIRRLGTTGAAGTADTTGFEAGVPVSEEAGSDAMAGMSASIAETVLLEGDGN